MTRIEIDEYKQIVLNILTKIEEICKDNNISYFLAYGTLLGAVRHKGFIPWDDDVDIGMLRTDYIKLRNLINSGEYGLKFIDIETEKNTIYPFGKVCDSSTHMLEKNFKYVPGYGAFVDVFPFDFMPNNQKERNAFCKRMRKKVIAITHASRTSFEKSKSAITNVKRFVAFHAYKYMNLEKSLHCIDKECQQYNNKQSSYIGVPWDIGGPLEEGGLAFQIDKIFPTEYSLFENVRLRIPADTDYVLKLMYGDYMKLPPIEKQVNKHQLNCYYK